MNRPLFVALRFSGNKMYKKEKKKLQNSIGDIFSVLVVKASVFMIRKFLHLRKQKIFYLKLVNKLRTDLVSCKKINQM